MRNSGDGDNEQMLSYLAFSDDGGASGPSDDRRLSFRAVLAKNHSSVDAPAPQRDPRCETADLKCRIPGGADSEAELPADR